MKRLLVAGAASVTVFSAVYGLAATLNVKSDYLGAGNVTVQECQAAPLTSSYTTEYTTVGTAGFKVNTVTVSGVQDSCDNITFEIELVGAAGAPLGFETGNTDTDGNFTADFTTDNVLASLVQGVHVTITGPNPS